MNSKQLWERFANNLRIYPTIQFSLDLSKMQFDEQALADLKDKATDALRKMAELEQGAIANPDENRMVGHYWLRSPELAPEAKIKKEIEGQILQIKEFTAAVHSGNIAPERQSRFENVIIIGIGGSALGPQLISDALWQNNQPTKLFFCDNTDPDGIARLLSQLGPDLDKTMSIVISKSGGTIETRNGQSEIKNAYERAKLSFGKHAVAITCEGSKLDKQAKTEGWIKSFYIWDFVGGRTSILSAVGLLPAALQGLDIDALLTGAKKMDQLTRNSDPMENPASLLASSWYLAGEGKGKKDMVILPYKDRLILMSKYLQQLVMESLGKEKDLAGNVVNQGIVVFGNKGSTDQHAYIQQLREGLNNFFVTFIEVLQDYTPRTNSQTYLEVEPKLTSGDYLSGFYLGTRKALYENGRSSITLTLDALTAESIGALIALYDRTVGLYAAMININAYHQPGVEAGKKAAARVTALQQQLLATMEKNKKEASTALELASEIGAEDEAETVYKILEHLSANPHRGVKRVGDRSPLKAKYQLA